MEDDTLSDAPPAFVPSAHRAYIKRVSEDSAAYEYAISEHLRMSGIYWAATALDLVDQRDALDGKAIIEFVFECQHPNGGFGGNVGHDAHILYTLSAVQLLVLFLGHRFRQAEASQFSYIDKCCVCQTDQVLKRQAIYNFEGILRRTKKMVILWDNDYFERLWCTFEIAAFSKHRGTSNIHFAPIIGGVFAIGMCVVAIVGVWANILLYRLGREFQWALDDVYIFFGYWSVVGTAVFWLPKFGFCYMLVEGRHLMSKQIHTFDARSAKCFDESDREFVELHIVDWFGSLDEFNDHVRHRLMDALGNSIGAAHILYRALLFENAVIFWFVGLDALLVASSMLEIIKIVILSVGEHLVFNPLFIYSVVVLAQRSRTLPCSDAVKNIVRVFGVVFLGQWWPLWFICCLNCDVWLSGAVLAAGAMAVSVNNRSRRQPAVPSLRRDRAGPGRIFCAVHQSNRQP